jgi:hypothetical protein
MKEITTTTNTAGTAIKTADVHSVQTAPGASTARLFASAVVPYMSYGAQRLGKAGVAGLSLVAFSVIMFVTGNLQTHRTIAEQTASLEAARVQSELQRSGAVAATPDQQAAKFVEQLPTVNDVPAMMGRIVVVAGAAGIELERGNYEFVGGDRDSISRYEMSLPVVGTYPNVRKFVENVLASEPSLALEGMRIERDKVTDQIISADLRFAILLGEPL